MIGCLLNLGIYIYIHCDFSFVCEWGGREAENILTCKVRAVACSWRAAPPIQ